jgi:hypothetical protein
MAGVRGSFNSAACQMYFSSSPESRSRQGALKMVVGVVEDCLVKDCLVEDCRVEEYVMASAGGPTLTMS